MARRAFFSFHYDNDCRRAAQVRNSNVIQRNLIESPGFIDAVSWEKLKEQGDEAIERWIRCQMEGTSVTVVLIGSQTVDYSGKVRPWTRKHPSGANQMLATAKQGMVPIS